MFCIEWICRTTSGTSAIRTTIVSAMIDQAHVRPTLSWKKSRTALRRFSRGVIGLARIIQASRVVHSAAAPRVAAKQPPARLRRADDQAVLAERVDRVLRADRVGIGTSPP